MLKSYNDILFHRPFPVDKDPRCNQETILTKNYGNLPCFLLERSESYKNYSY
jgi:hypothetical protein